jgi:hypothetical protein
VALALREQARTMAAADDLDGAALVLQDARARFEALAEDSEMLATDVVLAEVLLDGGRVAEAGALLAALAADESALSPTLHRLVGRHHFAEDRVEAAAQALQRGLEVAGGDSNRYEEGLLLLELATVKQRAGRPYAAAAARGRDILEQMGVLVG